MRMSTKGRFAVNAMIDLALRERGGPVALAAIAQRQQISLSYLEQLFARLRREGLVESTRGPGGGYTLGRKPEDITLADIVATVDDPAEAERGESAAAAAGAAQTEHLWVELNQVMLRHMATISLRTLMDDQIAKGVSVEARPLRRAFSPQPVVKPVRTNAPNSVFALGRTLAAG